MLESAPAGVSIGSGFGVDDEDGDGGVVQDVVADAAQQGGADGTSPARAHDDEVVVAVRDLVDQRDPDGLLGQHRRHGQVIGDPVARVTQHRFGLSMRACDQLADRRAGHEAAGARDARQRGHDGEAGVLALGEVDRLRERLIGLRGAIDGDQDVVKHDALSIRSGRSPR